MEYFIDTLNNLAGNCYVVLIGTVKKIMQNLIVNMY